MTSAGVQNVLTKSLGTANPHNVIKATFDALVQLRDRAEVATVRGKQVAGAVIMADNQTKDDSHSVFPLEELHAA